MIDFEAIKNSEGIQPYFIYKRLLLTSSVQYFLHTLDYGFWYLLRTIHIKYAQDNGITHNPDLRVFAVQKGINKEAQNAPIPLNLFCTPGNSGIIQSGVNMTAGKIKGAKLQNVVYPYRDTMEFQITNQAGGFPSMVDICLIGYYIPVKENQMWSKKDGKN